MKQESTGLRKLMESQLKDMYYAEQQLVKTLPKLAEKAQNEELRTAFEEHLAETREHVKRLEEVFSLLDMPKKGEKCPAIDGILQEGKEIMEEFADDPALDAGLIAAGQKAEHYEIATYGFLVEWADCLGLDDVKAKLQETLQEEKDADSKLTEIARSAVNSEGEVAE